MSVEIKLYNVYELSRKTTNEKEQHNEASYHKIQTQSSRNIGLLDNRLYIERIKLLRLVLVLGVCDMALLRNATSVKF